MKTQDLDYTLPEDRIASRPLDKRSASRMLVLPRQGGWSDVRFDGLADWLNAGDLLVINDTRVIPARMQAQRPGGGHNELLLCDPVDERTWWVMAKGSKRIKPGQDLRVGEARAEVLDKHDSGRVLLRFDCDVLDLAERQGHMPLPPYIGRDDDDLDRQRYQTVFADKPGAVAAPTAALHFDDVVLQNLQDKGVRLGRLTLHVGPGTFQPVRCDDLDAHPMHAERFVVGEELVAQVDETHRLGGRVVAVGTTVTRSLESVALGQGRIEARAGSSSLLIQPGYTFKVVDALLTNFHLPRSTLLALVMALRGRERVLAAYAHAIEQGYRFYSYGDCMLII